MEQICDKNQCMGCCACMNICPKNCISMEYDEYGVMHPVIDKDKCIDCGACKRICPALHASEKRKPQKAYAAWHLNDTDRKKSASGGVAAAFYQKTIEKGGVCFGTSIDENISLNFHEAANLEQIQAFRGSKYVQAYVGYTYQAAKKQLEQGTLVTYIGTPCQIAGLKQFLRKDYDNLITVDLICHGVPSIKYLQEHVAHLEKKTGKKADRVSFRGEYTFELVLYKAEQILYRKYRFLDSYFTGFLNGLFYRPNCYSCPYACEERVSDITIGDFWGIGQELAFHHKKDSVSVILVNTDKGRAFVEESKDKLYMEERPVSEAVNGNDQLRHPSEKNEKYEEFRALYLQDGFESAAFECTKKDIKEYKKKHFITKMKQPIWNAKKRVKKLLHNVTGRA